MGKEVKLWPCHYHSRIAIEINWTNLTSMAKNITFCWANPWFFPPPGWLQSLQSSFTTIQSQYINRVSLDFRIFISLQLISPQNFLWERCFLKGLLTNLIWFHHSKILQSFYLLSVLCVVSHFMCEASFRRHPNHCDPSQNMQIFFFWKFEDVSKLGPPKSTGNCQVHTSFFLRDALQRRCSDTRVKQLAVPRKGWSSQVSRLYFWSFLHFWRTLKTRNICQPFIYIYIHVYVNIYTYINIIYIIYV